MYKSVAKEYKINQNTELASRYRGLNRVRYTDGTEIIETQNMIVFPKHKDDKYYAIKAGEAGRLDLVSYVHYGTHAYDWAIAAASNIYDMLSVPVGTVVRIPPIIMIRNLVLERSND